MSRLVTEQKHRWRPIEASSALSTSPNCEVNDRFVRRADIDYPLCSAVAANGRFEPNAAV